MKRHPVVAFWLIMIVLGAGIAQADTIYDIGFISPGDTIDVALVYRNIVHPIVYAYQDTAESGSTGDGNISKKQGDTTSNSANNAGESGPGMYSLFGNGASMGSGSGSGWDGGAAGWQGLDVIYALNDAGGTQDLGQSFRISGGLWPFHWGSGPAAPELLPSVPEPGTLLLIGSGLVGLGLAKRKGLSKKRKS